MRNSRARTITLRGRQWPLTRGIAGLICLVISGLLATRAAAQTTTARFVVAPPPDGRSVTAALRQAIGQAIAATNAGKAVRARVVLEAGDYPLDAIAGDEYAILSINGAHNVSIGGAGAATRLVVRDHSPNRQGLLRKVISITNTDGFVMQNLSIDFAPGARDWLQGIAKDVAADPSGGVTFRLELDKYSPPFRADTFACGGGSCLGITMDGQGRPRGGLADYFIVDHVVAAGSGVTVTTGPWSAGDYRSFLDGQRVVLIRRKPGEALFSFNGRNVHPALCNIRVLASRGMMIEAYGCDRLELDHLTMEPAAGQWLVSPGDGLHYQGGVSGPYVHDCHFAALGDDAMNLYAKPFQIAAEPKTGLLACADARHVAGIGDRLWICARAAPGKGQVIQVEQLTDHTIRGQAISANLVPDRAINLSKSGAGFVIRHNTFGPMRGIGCRVQCGDGLIEDNCFTHLSGPAVSLESGLGEHYDEGPFPYNIMVRGNHFDHCGVAAGYDNQAIRRIAPWNLQSKPDKLPFSHLTVVGNTIGGQNGTQ